VRGRPPSRVLETRWPIPIHPVSFIDDRDFLRGDGAVTLEFGRNSSIVPGSGLSALPMGMRRHLALGEARGSRDEFDGGNARGIGRVEQAVGDGGETPTSVRNRRREEEDCARAGGDDSLPMNAMPGLPDETAGRGEGVGHLRKELEADAAFFFSNVPTTTCAFLRREKITRDKNTAKTKRIAADQSACVFPNSYN